MIILLVVECTALETNCHARYVAIAEDFEFPIAALDDRIVKSDGPKCESCCRKLDKELLDSRPS